ncbi:hypothetical protein PHMEG_00021221 [Phytophthora megakarya]|uniref:ZSWIM1/3 RNaseH-like domain-containing protein n=1 Tax=Phytophthora megakarya TaxID=4795 RepID=A0A225VMD9_9STRA|nr:hypothetical protein PHMEG_00021221 [Phytophthora megakarya]
MEGMLVVGAKQSRIYDYLLEHDQNVLPVDVDNMVHAHSTSIVGNDDDEATTRVDQNEKSVADAPVGETGVILLASARMRRLFTRLCELLLVDCTHKTNRIHTIQLPTLNIHVHAFGEGAVVHRSIIKSNGDWDMDKTICHFKRVHPDRTKMVRVIMADNDICVLERHFPAAGVLICHFHVVTYLKEMRSKPEFGKILQDDAGQVATCIHNMVYATSNAAYDAGYAALRGLGFFVYFDKNWNGCQDRWVLYRRTILPHFSNLTNNRLESYFSKLKEGVEPSSSMA